MIDVTDSLMDWAKRIDRKLDALLTEQPADGEIQRPERLMAAMRYACLSGGKRLRPYLLAATCAMLGAPAEDAETGSVMIELIHCYSLIHDDLPAMDNDDLRRGRPTVHRAFDEATAILAGDALLTLAFDVATHLTIPIGNRLKIVRGLARAAGMGGMVGGQMLDLAAEGRFGARPLTHAEIGRMQAMKTGALIAFSVEAGAIIGDAHDELMQRLLTYGRAVGAAFQITDDLLDREADEATLGKRAGKDAERGKATLVDALGMAEARQARDALVAKAIEALEGLGDGANELRAAAHFAGKRTF
jgi:farnesyl diphosphate synthase